MKKLLALILAIIILISFGGCAKENDEAQIIGVWLHLKSNWDGDFYYYFYEDGTGDVYGTTATEEYPHHFNAFTWKIEDDYLVMESWGFTYSISKYSMEDSEMYNNRNELAFTKVSDDPTVDIEIDG